jgi:Domain of unknown function (DUF4868)
VNLEYDLSRIATVEFGVGLDQGENATFVVVPSDAGVQEALSEMAKDSWAKMSEAEDPEQFEPSEKYSSTEYVFLPIGEEWSKLFRELHQADNLPTDAQALGEPASVFAYFARLTDDDGKRLTAVRRAVQFKGILKSRVFRVMTDAVKLIDDDLFRLDHDFDVLVDESTLHILHPTAFEFTGQLQQAVLEAVPDNIAAIKGDLDFVDFDSIEIYSSAHSRAARYVASIRAQKETANIDAGKLKELCRRTGVGITTVDGRIVIEEGAELAFLEVLDRRRYEVELVKDAPERYRSPSRKRIN